MFHKNNTNSLIYSEYRKNITNKTNPNRYSNRNDSFFQRGNYQMEIYPQNNNDKLNKLNYHYQTKTNDDYQYNRIYNTNSLNNHNFYSSSTQKYTTPINYMNSYSVHKRHKMLKDFNPKKQEISFSKNPELNIEKNDNFYVLQINKTNVKREIYKKIHPGRGTSTSFANINDCKKIKYKPELKYQSFNTSFLSNCGLKEKRNKSTVKLRKNNLEDLNIDKLKDYAEKFSGNFLNNKKNNNNNNNTPKKNENNEHNENNDNNKAVNNKNIIYSSKKNYVKNNISININNIRNSANTNKGTDNDYSNKKTMQINENKDCITENNVNNNKTDNNFNNNKNDKNDKNDKQASPQEKNNNIIQPQKNTNNNNKLMREPSNIINRTIVKNKQILIPKKEKEKVGSTQKSQNQSELNTNINIEKSLLEIPVKKNLIKKGKNLSNASSIAASDDIMRNNSNNNLKKNFLFHNINNTSKTTEHKFIQKYNNQQYHEIVFKKNDSETNADDTSSNDKQYYLENTITNENLVSKKIIDNLDINLYNDNNNYNSKQNILSNYKVKKYQYNSYGLDDRHNLDGISNHSYFESVNLKKNNKK